MNKLIKFASPTCNPCKILENQIKDVDFGVPVEKVDISIDKDAVNKYNLRSLPTVIMFRGDLEVGRLVGIKTVQDIKDLVKLAFI
jgi:thioredoxin-like negative regulator of GroEL